MTLTTKTTLAGLVAAAAIGWTLGGRAGAGTLAGFLAGATVAGFALAAQRRLARRGPQMLAASVLAGFVLKAFAMLGLTLTVRYVEPLHALLDAPAFLFGFAGATLLVLGPATVDTLRALDSRRNDPQARLGEARPT